MKNSTPALKAKSNGTNTPRLGLDSKQREGAVCCLNVALANAYVLSVKTKKAHWDVVGPQFMMLHKLWDEQYALLEGYIDNVAERVRTLGGFPVATLQGFLAQTELKEHPLELPMATAAVVQLVDDHEAVVRSLRVAVRSCADDFNDAGTADFLTGMMEGHEKMAWILRSFLEGTAIQPSGQGFQKKSQAAASSGDGRRFA